MPASRPLLPAIACLLLVPRRGTRVLPCAAAICLPPSLTAGAAGPQNRSHRRCCPPICRRPQVRSLAPLSSLRSTQLTELYAACNKVTAIESMEQLGQLQVLELGGNRIRVLQGEPWQIAWLAGLLWRCWPGLAGWGRCLSAHLLPCPPACLHFDIGPRGQSGLRRCSTDRSPLRLAPVPSARPLLAAFLLLFVAASAGLAHLSLLQELWLGRNRVAEIGQGLEQLRSLRRLSLQSNRLTSMAGLQHCTALEELYLRWVLGRGVGQQAALCAALGGCASAVHHAAARHARACTAAFAAMLNPLCARAGQPSHPALHPHLPR